MDESESDKFITRIKDFSAILEHVENKDIVLLLGPTGSGKSTILNMIAGSKITCKKNESDEWEVHADPSVTTIGHIKSETFLPVYWQDSSGNRFYDCPGFNETRGIDYNIANSYFLKTIGDCAKSLKIILVGDFHTLSAERGEAFGKVVQQIKNLIPDFELTTDSELIVTKANHSKNQCHISKLLKNWSYPESKITILHEPDEKSGTFCDVDFFGIIGRSSSITTKCDFPLSNSAKFKINKLKDEFNKEIKETLSVLSKRVNFCYLDLIQNNLEVSDDTLANWYESFKDVESKIKNSPTVELFQENFDNSIIGLKTLNKSLQTDDLSLFLKRKIENLDFLKKISNEVEHLVSYWVSSFNFNYHPLSKGKNLAKFKKLEDFNSFLKGKNLDPQMDIRNQIHEVLNTGHNFSANYSGSKSHSGTVDYTGEVSYSGHQPYSGTVNNCEELLYSGSVYYSGNQPYSGNVTVKSCYNPFCQFCLNQVVNKSRYYSGSVYYSGYQPYSGSIKHFVKESYSGIIDYSGSVPYSGKVDYNVTVPYSGSHVVTCQDHHTCSCEELSSIFLSAKELCEDIEYYQNIIKLQKQYLNQEDNELLSDSSNFKSFFSLNGKISLDDKIEYNDLTNEIHQTLKKILNFDVKYSDQVDYVVQKTYSGEASYSGNKPYSGTVNCEDLLIPYSGKVYYSGDENFSGTVSTTNCSHDEGLFNVKCWLCSHDDISIPYSGSVHYSGYQDYSGSIKHFVKTAYSGNIDYSGTISYSGEVNHVISIPYSGTNTVTCQEDHHDCDSCDTWDLFVSGLTALLKEKEKHISIIEKRKATLVH